MRAPLSQLASDVLADPQAAKAMRQWIDNPTAPLDLTINRPDGTSQLVHVTRRQTITPTHGGPTADRSWQQRIRRFRDELLAFFINPVG